MYRIDDLRKFKNYYFSGKLADNFCVSGNSLADLNGVFGVICKKENKVFIARDLVGEMPLYFLVSNDKKSITVANTIKDLKDKATDFTFKSVRAVPTTYTVQVSLESGEHRYISNYKLPHVGQPPTKYVTAKEIVQRLNNAVRKRLPPLKTKVAVLLSGGTDSFSVSYLLKHYRQNFVAYTLTVAGGGKDLPNAQKAANFLNIPLYQVDVTHQQVISSVSKVVQLSELYKDYDVYMAVGSYFLAKRLKRDGIDVVYTGDGANELFGDYHTWGGFQMSEGKIMTQKIRRLMVFGRKPDEKYYNEQLGSGLGRSLSRINKIFFHFGIKVINPYLEKSVVEYILSLPKSFLVRHTKQELFQSAFQMDTTLFPEKIRLQDGTGISAVLFKNKIDDIRLKSVFQDIFGS